MKQISKELAIELLDNSPHDMSAKYFYIEGRNMFSDKPYIYTAYQVDCMGYEWLEVRTYINGESLYFASE